MGKRNYRKMSTESEVEQAVDIVEPAPSVQAEPEPVVGVVVGCGKLNIRKEPNVSGEIVYEALFKSELIIDVDKSTDEWFSVCTAAGIEGFCMKKFVEIK